MHGLKRWLKRVGLALVILLGLAAGAGYTYEHLARARERRSPPGVLVDVGGFRLHLYCTGMGSPAVILDTGLGLASPTWRPVQDAVSKTTRVCSYDRAGYLWSDPGPKPRTSDEIVTELHTLLERAGERPPFVLVGHSFGGYNVRLFAYRYPAEAAGLVLVDSSHEDQVERMPESLRPSASTGMALRVASSLGVLRLLGAPAPPAAASEMAALGASADAVRKARDLGSLPLIVLTAGQVDTSKLMPGVTAQDVEAFQAIWMHELQPDLARLSTRGEQRIVADSTHLIPVLRPQAVVDAIDSVLQTVRDDGR